MKAEAKTKAKKIENKTIYRVVSMENNLTSPCRKNCPDKGTLICLDADTCPKIAAYRRRTQGYEPTQSAINMELGYLSS